MARLAHCPRHPGMRSASSRQAEPVITTRLNRGLNSKITAGVKYRKEGEGPSYSTTKYTLGSVKIGTPASMFFGVGDP